MGEVTPNMSIYVPAAGETNYDASFLSGMINVDQHDHSGPPDNGVPISGAGLAAGSVTFDKLNANVADNATGIGTETGGNANKLKLLGVLPSIFSLATNGILVKSGTNAFTRTIVTGNANEITVTNGDGTGGNPTIEFPVNVYNSTQPKFLATLSATATGVTGDGTVYTVVYDNVVFDKGSNYDNTTGMFTAPITAQYIFYAQVNLQNLEVDNTQANTISIVTTNRTYQVYLGDIAVQADSFGNISTQMQIIADMTAADTAYVTIQISGHGTPTTDVHGQAATTVETQFSGALLL